VAPTATSGKGASTSAGGAHARGERHSEFGARQPAGEQLELQQRLSRARRCEPLAPLADGLDVVDQPQRNAQPGVGALGRQKRAVCAVVKHNVRPQQKARRRNGQHQRQQGRHVQRHVHEHRERQKRSTELARSSRLRPRSSGAAGAFGTSATTTPSGLSALDTGVSARLRTRMPWANTFAACSGATRVRAARARSCTSRSSATPTGRRGVAVRHGQRRGRQLLDDARPDVGDRGRPRGLRSPTPPSDAT
jgi:hypothetical protein